MQKQQWMRLHHISKKLLGELLKKQPLRPRKQFLGDSYHKKVVEDKGEELRKSERLTAQEFNRTTFRTPFETMAFILQDSEPAMQAENQLFAVPSSFTDRWKTEFERINPATVLTEDGSSGDITFYIPPSSHGLLSLNDIYLELEVAIKTRTGSNEWQFMTTADKAAPVTNFLHSLFQNLTVEMGGRTITDSSNYYAYRAYMENLLNHTAGAVMSQLSSSLFFLDEPAKFNDETNIAEISRRNYLTRGHFAQMSGRIAADLFDQSKPLITGMGLNIRLVLSKPDFCIRVWDPDTSKQFRAFVKNPRLHIRRYVPSPDYLLAVSQQLQTKTAKYHIERTVMRVTDIPRGTQSTVVSNIQIGQLPKVAFIGFVASEDFHGARGKNPFNFKNYNIKQVSIEVDGQSFPTKPYQMDFEKHQSLEAYDGLLDTLKQRNNPFGEVTFNREAYNHGYTIFGFDLTPGGTGRGALTLIRQGNLSVAVSFGQPLNETVMMVCMLVYDNILEINQHRQIIADFAT